jgi:hypothetical protein
MDKSFITPFNLDDDDSEFRKYCESQGEDYDKLLEEAGKAFEGSLEEIRARRKPLTKEEIQAIVDYEMSVDDMGNPRDV